MNIQTQSSEELVGQRRKFLKEMSALTGFAMITGAYLFRGAPLAIAGDPANGDTNWGGIKGRLVYEGDIPERSKVDLSTAKLSADDLKWFKSEGPILQEDWVVNKESRGVQWVYIWLIPEDAQTNRTGKLDVHESLKAIPTDKEFVAVDQHPLGYVPHAVAIREGQGIKMRNTGPVKHVFNLVGFNNKAINKAMDPKKELDITGLVTERITMQINCPPHPWERMWLRVFDHPYFAVTDQDGNFTIPMAPAGKCRMVVWQEALGYKGGRTGRYGQVVDVEGAAVTDLGDITITATTT